MSHTRRNALRIIGGGTIIAAAAAGGFLATRRPDRALEPWSQAGEFDDPRLWALSYGLLAPNPHNRQPWIVEMTGDAQFTLYRDTERDLPETDPFHRQLTIGLGCFLELTSIAAAETGHQMSVDLYPEGETGPVAVATLTTGAEKDPLFAQIPHRRSCRAPFEPEAINNSQAEALSKFATIITDRATVERLRTLTWDAWLTEAMTPRTNKESVDLMRFGKAEINANPDGIHLGGPMLETFMLLGMLTREAQLDPNSSGFQQGVKVYRDMLAATQNYAVITSDGNSRAEQIDAGRKWVRLNLTTTALGLSLHPVSQALQEFPEMAPHYEAAHGLLAPNGGTVQMLGRLGYGPTVPATPRWPLESRLRHV